MKKILVTGADGFIGSHLVELLVSEGYQVRALAQYNSFNNWGWLENINCLEDVEVLTGDVRDPYCCKNITKEVDTIFHLAALIAIPYSYMAPDSYVDTNIKGTLNICHAAIENQVERVIHTSTSEVYGSAKYVPIDESHPLQPQSPYSATKIGADSMALSFYSSFNLPVVVARPFNTYGPRQSARAVIPAIISQIAAGRATVNLGDLSPTRDFNYVSDTCQGFLQLAKCQLAVGEVVNIGSNTEISIADTFKLISEIMGVDIGLFPDQKRIRPENSEVLRLCCNNDKIKRLTGFSPKIDFRSGLIKTIEWFSDPCNLSRYKSEIYNV